MWRRVRPQCHRPTSEKESKGEAMNKMSLIAAAAAVTLPAGSAFAQQVDVVHYWTSGSESSALKVFADAFKERGGTWVDNAVGGIDNARAAVLNRVAGGNPPAALLDNIGNMKLFAEQGILSPLAPDVAKEIIAHTPQFLVQKMTVDGQIYAIPVDIGGNNWMWYSKKAFDDIGAEPPQTWDDFFSVAEDLKAKGYIPLAMGGQPWQEASLFYGVMLAQGRDFYKQVMVQHDRDAASGPDMVKTFETLRKLSGYVDEGSPGRNWNDATNLVITDKAAIQIMGDWAKGEFLNAGLTPGKEFGCAMAPGTADSYMMVVDLFDFPKVSDPDAVAGQKLLEQVLADKTLQADFSKVKGSLPARLDADLSDADMCLQMGQKIMSDPDAPVPNYEFVMSADQEGQVADLISNFWSSSDMSPGDATEQFAEIVTAEE
ncbi:ABC transporter substrate-binding protein [Consotaella aegiceratis]|uniref:ABC transporter substrate-binding protein n=1 Tax=Consotaella aegiceratis TaxID=3097961 RepID=UPI002F42F61E